MKDLQDYSSMTDVELWQTYNAVMANAWPGNEDQILAELEKRGFDGDCDYDPN